MKFWNPDGTITFYLFWAGNHFQNYHCTICLKYCLKVMVAIQNLQERFDRLAKKIDLISQRES